MPASRRSMLAATGAGLASLGLTATSANSASAHGGTPAGEAAELARRSAEANAALLRGEIGRYRAMIPLTADFTLMSPFGGTPTHGSALTEERWEAIGRFFRNGTLEQELVAAYASDDMAVLALIERCSGEVGGLPHQPWALRVTLVYRRENGEWRLAHRHADPLAPGVSLEHAAALARGEGR